MIPFKTVGLVMTQSKPRASGDDPGGRGQRKAGRRVNPARTGMIPGVRVPVGAPQRKPRASGDDPGRDRYGPAECP